MTNQDQATAGTTKPALKCRSCSALASIDDLAQDGTCPWCGGRHLTAYQAPELIEEAR